MVAKTGNKEFKYRLAPNEASTLQAFLEELGYSSNSAGGNTRYEAGRLMKLIVGSDRVMEAIRLEKAALDQFDGFARKSGEQRRSRS